MNGEFLYFDSGIRELKVKKGSGVFKEEEEVGDATPPLYRDAKFMHSNVSNASK